MIDDDSDEESEGLGLSSAGFGFVQGSSFQLVCNDTLSHSPSSSASTSSFPFTRNHHRLRPEISLVFLLTESWFPKVVNLLRVADTAAGGVFLRVPQILLTPGTGILSPRSIELLVVVLDSTCLEVPLTPLSPLFVAAV